ncbi:hypothetical protein HII31_04220 [Pseudocercospora fuligena]|uniref:Uncharacterized protein n=1 Tax=Pseudocercospora fuligena TaxID=685502 RepID=A0A8H6RM80_9PEZI|nr:hypothetical protein HII31_04220 [Pseudocercospora fuligena]
MQRSSPNTRMNSVKRSRSPTPMNPPRHSPDVDSSGSKRIKTEHATPAPTDRLANLRLSKNSEGLADVSTKPSKIPAGGRPQLAAYHPTFAQIEVTIGALCLEFGRRFTEIKMLGYIGDALDNTADEIARYTDPTDHYRPIKPIPLVGSMNVGKSLLATCLMDEVGAAIISALDRGTSTITEYHYLLPRQTTRFTIQLIFYTRDQIAALVEAFSQQVFEFLRLDKIRVEDPDEVDHDAWVDSQNECNAALEILSGILQECNVLALAEGEELRTWFCDQASDIASQTDASQHLITEVHTALDQRQNEGDPEIYPANTTKELLVFSPAAREIS